MSFSIKIIDSLRFVCLRFAMVRLLLLVFDFDLLDVLEEEEEVAEAVVDVAGAAAIVGATTAEAPVLFLLVFAFVLLFISLLLVLVLAPLFAWIIS